MSRSEIYGKVKQAAYQAQELGLSVTEAAELFGYKKRSIRSSADNAGIKLRPMRRQHGSVKAMVIKAVNDGLTARDASRLIGTSTYTVYSAARRMGLSFKPVKNR